MLRGHMLVAKTIDIVESFSTVPVSSKADPCASSYDIFKFCTLLTLLEEAFRYQFLLLEPFPFSIP